MPVDPSVDLQAIQSACEIEIKTFGAKVLHSVNQEPVAFGLKALVFTFLLDEKISNLEQLEVKIKAIPNVNSAEVIDVRRAIG